MFWAITRVAAPNFAAMREKGLQAHRDYLRSQKQILLMAGVMVTDDDKGFTGSVLIVHVNSRAEAQAFVDGDPFQKDGLFTDVKITRIRRGQWNPDVGEGTH